MLVYDVTAAIQDAPAVHTAQTVPAHPLFPHNTAPQVFVLSAVHPKPAVDTAAFCQFHPSVQLLPRRDIFAVPVRVSVPDTYIAKPSGLSTIPVLTVKLA